MFKKLKPFIEQTFEHLPTQQITHLNEKILIAVYGDYDKAKKKVETLRDNYPDDDDFWNAINEVSYPHSFKKFFSSLLSVNSIPQMVTFDHKITTGEIGSNITQEEALVIHNILEATKKYFDEILLKNGEQLLFEEIDIKVRFTLKEIRDDLGLHQKTFKKWLQFFFKDKYDYSRTISLSEYIEIYQQLILKEQEEKFDFTFNAEEYYKRLEDGLIFSKARLAKLAGSDYKQLALKMKSMDAGFTGMDFFPFRIAAKILEAMG